MWEFHNSGPEARLLTLSQLSNARIMNKGTDENIMTQLGVSSNEYNLVTALYYVRPLRVFCRIDELTSSKRFRILC